MANDKLKRIQIKITPYLDKKIVKASNQLGVTQSSYINFVLDQYFRNIEAQASINTADNLLKTLKELSNVKELTDLFKK